jgi:hypothetical protein
MAYIDEATCEERAAHLTCLLPAACYPGHDQLPMVAAA